MAKLKEISQETFDQLYKDNEPNKKALVLEGYDLRNIYIKIDEWVNVSGAAVTTVALSTSRSSSNEPFKTSKYELCFWLKDTAGRCYNKGAPMVYTNKLKIMLVTSDKMSYTEHFLSIPDDFQYPIQIKPLWNAKTEGNEFVISVDSKVIHLVEKELEIILSNEMFPKDLIKFKNLPIKQFDFFQAKNNKGLDKEVTKIFSDILISTLK